MLGGFLGQGYKSGKENRERLRDALGKKDHIPFDKNNISTSSGSNLPENKKELTDSERQQLINEVLQRDAKEVRKKTIRWILIMLIVITALILIYFRKFI